MTSCLVLDNGLRLLLLPRPGATAASVVLHVGVGYRSEDRSTHGFAHLFEHLWTQDAPAPTSSRTITRVQSAGGVTAAATHQDYTEFSHRFPAGLLAQVLQWEADKLRQPLFTAEHLQQQRDGVLLEIETRLHRSRSGAFPWPALPELLFDSWANAHDGLGDPARLQAATYDQCLQFFAEHYVPANIVLTIATDLGQDDGGAVRDLVHRTFGSLPAKPVPPHPVLDRVTCSGHRSGQLVTPGLRQPRAAAGFPLAAPQGDLCVYAAHMLTAALLSGPTTPPAAGPAAPWITSASCGFFGPCDSHDPDALVVVGTTGGLSSAEGFQHALAGRLAALSDEQVPAEEIAGAHRQVASQLRAHRAQSLATARWSGRGALLFDDADLLERLWHRLPSVGAPAVADAARSLRAGGHAALLALPPDRQPAGPGSTPPPLVSATPARFASTANGLHPGGAAGGLIRAAIGPGRVPLRVHTDAVLNGARVVAIQHQPDHLSVRLSVRLPPLAAWARAALLRQLRASRTLAGLATRPDLAFYGQDLVLSAEVDPAQIEVWLQVPGPLRAELWLLLPTLPVDPAGLAGTPAQDLAAAFTDVDWTALDACAGRPGTDRAGTGAPTVGPPAQPDRERLPALLVLVGQVSAVPTLPPDLGAARPANPDCEPQPPSPQLAVRSNLTSGPPLSQRLRTVSVPGASGAGFQVRSSAPPARCSAAEHLTVAVLAGVGGLSAAAPGRLAGLGSGVALAARAPHSGGAGAFVAGWAPDATLPTLLDDVAEVLRGHRDGPCEAELEAVKGFCIGQWTMAFDDPGPLADLLVQQLGLGQDLQSLATYADRLAGTTAAQVTQAWRARFDPSVLSGIGVYPAVDPPGEAAQALSGPLTLARAG